MVVRKMGGLRLYLLLLYSIIILSASMGINTSYAGKAKKAGGVVEGKVINRWAKIARYPTLVYIEKVNQGRYKAPKEPAIMNQIGAKFIPRLLPVLKGTKVNFLNGDNTQHNVYSTDNEKYSFDEFAPGEQRSYKFKRLGPYIQLCHTHPKMKAYIVVLQNPFYTFADDKGHFVLQDVPPGNWKLKVFNERMAREDTDKTFSITVTAGFKSIVDATW